MTPGILYENFHAFLNHGNFHVFQDADASASSQIGIRGFDALKSPCEHEHIPSVLFVF